jgi:hypothetical protein
LCGIILPLSKAAGKLDFAAILNEWAAFLRVRSDPGGIRKTGI